MTVWTELQSWIGAAASDVALDNEFKNIYLGLNEAANGNLPSGYNRVELTFTGASLTIKGETKMSALNVPLDSTLTVTGAAGWRYIVTTNGGVMSVESIPGAEITADTQVYTPTPVFNSSANGYYSTVNTARRIVGICYFDATNIKEVIAYGTGKNKRDGYLYGYSQTNPSANVLDDRLQYTGTIFKSRGNITLVDNGAGTSPSSGMRIINNISTPITVFGSIQLSALTGGAINIVLHKNGTEVVYSDIASHNNLVGSTTIEKINFTYTDNYSSSGDFYQLYINTLALAVAQIFSIGAYHV